MGTRQAKHNRKELKKIYKDNVDEMFLLFVGGLAGKPFRVRWAVARAIIRKNVIPWATITGRGNK